MVAILEIQKVSQKNHLAFLFGFSLHFGFILVSFSFHLNLSFFVLFLVPKQLRSFKILSSPLLKEQPNDGLDTTNDSLTTIIAVV